MVIMNVRFSLLWNNLFNSLIPTNIFSLLPEVKLIPVFILNDTWLLINITLLKLFSILPWKLNAICMLSNVILLISFIELVIDSKSDRLSCARIKKMICRSFLMIDLFSFFKTVLSISRELIKIE